MKKLLNILIKGVIALTFILSIIAIFREDLAISAIEWVKVAVTKLGYWNYLIVGISSMIESFPLLGVVVPGQNILMIVGGFFAEISRTNLIYVSIIAAIGAIIGNYVGYLLGIKYGDDFFKEYGLWLGITETDVKYLKKSLKTWGPWGIIFGKFHGMTRSFVPFIAGSMGMKSKEFLIYNVIGSIFWAISMVVIGIFFAANYEVIVEYLAWIIMAMIIIGIGYMYIFRKPALHKYMDEKNQEIEQKLFKNK